MSKNDNAKRKGGRERTPAETPRGRAILRALDAQGLTLYAAARKAKIPFAALYKAIHGDPSKLTVRTVTAMCARLGLPLSVVAPSVSALATTASVA